MPNAHVRRSDCTFQTPRYKSVQAEGFGSLQYCVSSTDVLQILVIQLFFPDIWGLPNILLSKGSFSDMWEQCKRLAIRWNLCLHICEWEFNSAIYRELIPRDLEQHRNEMHVILVDFPAPAACLHPSLSGLGTACSTETARRVPGVLSWKAVRAEENHWIYTSSSAAGVRGAW